MCPPTGDQPAKRPSSPEERSQQEATDPFPWHIGVCDAHCHPTDTMSSITSISGMKTRVLTIMATRAQDQNLVASVAAKHGVRSRGVISEAGSPEKIVPAFGWHPWFSHQFYDGSGEVPDKAKHYESVLTPAPDADFIKSLPDPRPLSEFISETRQRLLNEPLALVGEVGVDKAFRLPSAQEQPTQNDGLTPGGRDGRTLSPYHVKMPHQVAVLKEQLRLAGEIGRPASVHGVQAHGVLYDALASLWKGHEKEVISKRKMRLVAEGAEDFSSSDEDDDYYGDDDHGHERQRAVKPYTAKPFPPRVCLHSFSGPPQMMSQYLHPAIPADIFFSFSTCVNLSMPGLETKFAEVVKACPDDKLLIESDLHTAGEEIDYQLELIGRRVCEVKGWTLEEGLRRIRRNYDKFIFG